MLTDHIEELLPIVHEPTMGRACLKYGLMFKNMPRGLFISLKDRGYVRGIFKARHGVPSRTLDSPPAAPSATASQLERLHTHRCACPRRPPAELAREAGACHRHH